MSNNDSHPNQITSNNLEILGQAWMRMIGCIIHDLTTPLATMRIISRSLKDFGPELIEGYRLAVNNNLIKEPIYDKRLQHIDQALASGLSEEINDLFDFLKLLYSFNQALFPSEIPFETYDAKAFIQNSLEHYPFVENQKLLVEENFQHNFQFSASRLFIEQLFSHLMEIALAKINQAGEGKILIQTEINEKHNVIKFRYATKEVTSSECSGAFQYFFSKKDNKIVPGLGFCRLALLHSGGDILCHVEEDQFVEFIIKFPQLG